MKRLSKEFYVTSVAAGMGLGLVCTIVTHLMRSAAPGPGSGIVLQTLPLSMASVVLYAYAYVVLYVLYYKMWAAIQDGHARTTPPMAVGFLFIPLFNLYWRFQAVWGFSKDCNRYIERHSSNARKLPEGLFLSECLLQLFSVGLGFMVAMAAIMLILVGLSSHRYGLLPRAHGVLNPLLYPLDVVMAALLVVRTVLAAKVCDTVNALPEPETPR